MTTTSFDPLLREGVFFAARMPAKGEVYTNYPPDGGFARFDTLGHEEATVGVALQRTGYRTALLGKYLNGYPTHRAARTTCTGGTACAVRTARAPRDADLFPNVRAPRTPSFNEANVSDKPKAVRNRPPLTDEQIGAMDLLYRRRLRQLSERAHALSTCRAEDCRTLEAAPLAAGLSGRMQP